MRRVKRIFLRIREERDARKFGHSAPALRRMAKDVKEGRR